MKKIVLLFMLLICLDMKAQDKKPVVVAWEGNVERMIVFVDEEPTVKIDGGWAIFAADGTFEDWYSEYEYRNRSLYYAFPINDNFKLTIEERAYHGYPIDDDTEGVSDITIDSKPSFKILNGQLSVWNLKPNAEVGIYNVSGMRLSFTKAINGYAQLDLPVSSGIIIVKAGDVSFKIIVR